jgi:Tol biopolymer transport system component/DNA-binding winged helix-turn-helix (wHTH) protein
MLPETKDFYTFADFRLDATEKTLWRDGKVVGLTPKVFDTLLIFVKNAGRLLEKEELMREIWRDSFVEESNLTFNVKTLRRVLGDDAQNPLFIETVPRRGYRFIAEVRRETAQNLFNGSKKQNEPETKEISAPVPVQANGNLQTAANLSAAKSSRSLSQNKTFIAAFLGICSILILTVAASTVYALYRWYNVFTPAPNQPVISKSNITRLTSSGNVRSAAVSPDGKFVAYISEDNDKFNFYLKNLHNGGQVQISLTSEAQSISNITFSPDGNYLFYGANGALYQSSVLGGNPKKVLADYPVMPHNKITFSPDGKQFAFIRLESSENGEIGKLIAVNVNGGTEQILAESKRPAVFYRSAAWSPDGQTIVCAAQNAAGHQEIVAVNVKSGAILPVSSAPRWGVVREVAWKPDGSGLVAIAVEEDGSGFMSQIWSISYPLGATGRITDDANDYQSLSLTNDGNSIVAVRAEQEAHLWVASGDANESQPRQLTDGFEKFDGIFGINWINDGRIIYEAAPSGKPEVWQIGADGRNAEQIAEESGSTAASPDGKYLVYQSGDKEGIGLFRLDWKNGEKKRLTAGTDIDPAFAPNGKWLVFTRYADDVSLWRVSIDGGEAVKLTNLSGYAMSPTVSPDGKYIAFFHSTNSTKKPPSFAVIAAESGSIVKEFAVSAKRFKGNGKVTVQWAADGQSLVYADNKDGVSNLWRQPFDGKPPVQITNFASGQIFNFAAAPVGEQFAISRGTFARDVVSLVNVRKTFVCSQITLSGKLGKGVSNEFPPKRFSHPCENSDSGFKFCNKTIYDKKERFLVITTFCGVGNSFA